MLNTVEFSAEHVHDRSVHVIDIVYTPLIGGFCIVLSNGKAALLTSPSPRFHPKVICFLIFILNHKPGLV